MRYAEWEYTRRIKVDELIETTRSATSICSAMGSGDIDQWARDYFPVFDRQGLIIDVRHNHGGNIDSWLLADLLRKAWFYWQPRMGNPSWNMQYAFRGHIVVLCDHETASDGEAFSEGFSRLKLGKVIGTRTWGGEIWLSGSNVQADNGSHPQPRLAFMPTANGSSRAMASIPTRWWTIRHTRHTAETMRSFRKASRCWSRRSRRSKAGAGAAAASG